MERTSLLRISLLEFGLELPAASGLPARLVLAGVLLMLVAGASQARAQETGTITGQVTEAASDEPLPGVNVLVVGTELGTATGADGTYTIEQVPAGAQTVTATFVGYGTRRRQVDVEAGETLELDFELQESALNLEEVVVTGTAGGQRKRAVGNAVTQIDAAEVTDVAPISNVEELINGRSPGTAIIQGTGQVGSGSRIRIRGLSSFSLSNQPLLYVDGIRVDNAEATGPQVQAFGSSIISRVNDIPPNSIKSVEVIKGPAAATLYGTEASNGVIQITTKNGTEGAPAINFSTQQGAGWFKNAVDRMPTNYWRNPETGEVETLNMLALARDRGDNVFRTGYTQQYALNARGGGENVRYYVGGNFSDDEGVEADNYSRKWGVQAKVDVTPTENININTSLGYVSGRYNLSREAGFGGAMWALLYSSPQLLDTPTQGYRSATPAAYREPFDDFQKFNRTTVSVQADHQPAEWLTHRLTVGVDRVSENNQTVAEQISDKYAPFFSPTDAAGFKNVDVREALNTTVDYSATLDVDLSESLASNTTGGVQYYRDYTEFISADGEEFPAPGLSAIDATARTFGGNSSVENATLGVFLQEQLALSDRLFVTGAVRADDNSAFGQDFGLILYPKASLSWVISEEPFWGVPFVEQLKLRGAYGKSGKQPDAFAALRTYQPVTGTGDRPAVITQFVGNPDLGPEVGEEIELGFDLSALSDRLGLEFTYYDQRTRDAILLRDVPPSSGFPEAQFVNAGQIHNWGVEALLRGRPVDAENVEWGLNLSIATNANEVVDLIGDQETIVLGSHQHRIGYPVNSFFRRKVVSAELNDQGRAVNAMCADGDGGTVSCADAPRVYLGRITPKLEGSFSTTLTLFDRLRLYALLDFKTGYTKLNNTERIRCQIFLVCEANARPETADPAVLAQYQSGGPLRNVFYEDSDFAKLREISAQYTLPQQWAAPLGARRVTVGLAARNLLTWAPDWTGLDPETQFLGGGQDLEQNSVPQLTTIQARLNISF